MSEYEYITVLFSIILGLGVAQLLSGFARLLRDGRALAPAWWIFVLIATLLLTDFQVWWVPSSGDMCRNGPSSRTRPS